MRVLITGGGGNLGCKLRAHLDRASWCSSVLVLDKMPVTLTMKEEGVVADLTDGTDRRWIDPMEQADAVVHLAATDPSARSGWTHGRDSFGMTANLLANVGRRRPCRFVFASSNHAMGLYKDFPIPGSGKIGMNTPPLAGTHLWTDGAYESAAGYGASKLMGERLCLAAAEAAPGMLSAVSLRIGWCQPGENSALTLETRGGIASDRAPDPSEAARDLQWFRNMWLSNRDYGSVMERALLADSTSWPYPAIIVAAVSNNLGTPWDLDEAESLIGYEPKDDVWAELASDNLATRI